MPYVLKKIEAQLEGLSLAARLGFALVCAERCLEECRHLSFSESQLAELPQAALRHCRQMAEMERYDYEDEMRALHLKLGELIPEAEDETADEPEQSPILIRVSYAMCELFMMFQRPDDSARYAALIGAEVAYLRSNLYSGGANLSDAEFRRQLRLLARLAEPNYEPAQLQHDTAADDYERGDFVGWM